MTTARRPAREGFALAVALFALTAIGALIAGVFFASTQEYRVGRNTLLQQQAFAVAEHGLNAAVRDWEGGAMNAMARGATRQRTVTLPNGTADVRVTRLNDLTWWAVSEGRVGGVGNGARRRTNSVLRLRMPTLNVLGAMTVNGSVTVSGTAAVRGQDTNAEWTSAADCPPVVGGLPGVVVPPGETVDRNGAAVLTGSPSAWTTSPSAGEETRYFSYGGLTWDDLVSMATTTGARLPGGTHHPNPSLTPAGTCNRLDDLNWGDPRRTTRGPCADYFPIIYVDGNLTLNSFGVGQGILLVNGNLRMTGGFQFYGPVIVRGDFSTAGTGGHVYGALMSSRATLESTVALAGNAEVNYSSCAVNTALRNTATPGLAVQRGWADIY